MSLILDGTNGLSDVDGTAATPAIRGTDANTGIFFPAADTIAFSEGGAEVARFDSAGNFGIGTTSPSFPLDVKGTSTGAITARVQNLSANTAAQAELLLATDGANWRLRNTFSTAALSFLSGSDERMRIDSSGVVQVGNNNGTGEVFAQNTVKVWGALRASDGVLYNSFGVSSSSKLATGQYTINYSRTFSNSRFGCGLSQYSAGYSFINNESTTQCRINTRNTSNVDADADIQFLIAAGS
jgi:hypothetical protein